MTDNKPQRQGYKTQQILTTPHPQKPYKLKESTQKTERPYSKMETKNALTLHIINTTIKTYKPIA